MKSPATLKPSTEGIVDDKTDGREETGGDYSDTQREGAEGPVGPSVWPAWGRLVEPFFDAL